MSTRLSLELTSVCYHNSATEVLNLCQSEFKARELDANIIYPFLLKAKSADVPTKSRSNPIKNTFAADSDTDSSDDERPTSPRSPAKGCDEQFWLTVWTKRGRQSQLDLVASCTTGPIGKYPVFLYSNVPDEELTPAFVAPRMEQLVTKLKSSVSSKRVFSAFGPVPLTQAFVKAWSAATGAIPVIDPYYAAKHTSCTRDTLNVGSSGALSPLSPTHNLRLASPNDLIRTAELCYGFAAGSEPFTLSCEDAIKEARGYIQSRQMYVYDILSDNGTRKETASIVCVTRTSAGVSAITKVYTNPHHRGRKCAEKLVRYVCRQMLYEAKKNAVVLFVAHDNKAAEKVYDRVGFQGLCGKPRPASVNDWIEIGFENTEVGHW